jgi:hypothetical protein
MLEVQTPVCLFPILHSCDCNCTVIISLLRIFVVVISRSAFHSREVNLEQSANRKGMLALTCNQQIITKSEKLCEGTWKPDVSCSQCFRFEYIITH